MSHDRLIPQPRAVPPPTKHQLALMIWLAVFPTLTVLNLTLGGSLKDLPIVARTFVLATIAVPIVIYGVMPHLHRLRARSAPDRAEPSAAVTAASTRDVITDLRSTPMLVRVADWCYRRRRLVVALWVAALVGSFALAAAFGGEFRQNYLQPGSESKAASDTLTESFPQRAGDTVQVVVHSDGRRHARRTSQAKAEKIFADVARSAHVVGVTSPFTDAGAGQVSEDGTTAYADVALDQKDNEFTVAQAKALVEPVLAAGDGTLQVEVGGRVAALSQTASVASEGIGLLAAAIILLITFGSAVAMGLPLLTALFGLGIATAVGGLVMRVVDVPDWAPPTAAMVGLGIGIDYALLIVTRFRGSLAQGQDPRRATLTAISDRRASRPVRRAHRDGLDARHPAHAASRR